MSRPDFTREPWKHPALWQSHLVKMTRDYPGHVAVSVATCQCGWVVCALVAGAGHVAQDDAIHAHWLEAIADAEAVPA